MKRRLDVRQMLAARGWQEERYLFLRKGLVDVSCNGTDVFVTGPGNRGYRATVTFPVETPARVIVALCETWAS